MNAINSNEQMIQKINEVLQNKKDAIVNIVNDKLTISVFSLLEKNLQNVKEINFVIRDVKFLPHQSEMAHEFEINPTDILFNAYDITEKNKLQHFSKARSMHDFIEKHVNIRKVNAGIHIGGNILIIDDDFMIQGSSSLEVSKKSSRDAFSNINFDTILNGSADKEQILGALGYPYTGVKERVFDGSLLHQALGTVKIEKDKYILYIWFQILEFVANSIPRTDDCSRQYAFVQKVAIALKLSGVNAVICIDGDEYKFFPYSEAFFDKPMVVDVINWLSVYEKAQKQYRQALNDMLKGKYDICLFKSRKKTI